MIEVLKSEYWSKADAFLLPLTGLKKEQPYELNSYLFWKDYSVKDYKLILSFSYEDYETFVTWCRDRCVPDTR
jgi:hypothetical protein